MVSEDKGFVEVTDAERASLAAMRSAMAASLDEGSESFQSGSSSALVDTFAALVEKSDDSVCDGGVSYADLAGFVARAESTERSQIVQRIADRKLPA